MDDIILKAKKEIKCIVKEKGLTQLEKYDLIRKKRKELRKKELRVLISEYHRDYASTEGLGDMAMLATIWVGGVGAIIAITGYYFNHESLSYEQFGSLLGMTVGAFVLILLMLTALYLFRSCRLSQIQYILDALEGK